MKKLLITAFILAFGMTSFAAAEDVMTEAKLYYNQGVDHYKVGLYDKSMAAFRKAIELDPNYTDAYFNLGSILEYLQQYDAALSTFKQIIVRNPNDYEATYKAAYLSAKLNQNDNAKAYLSIIPPNAPIYQKAQELAYKLNTDLQTIKEEQIKANAQTTKPGIYEDIVSPTGITSDTSGNLYIAGFSDNIVYKITPEGQKMVFLKDARLSGPIGMVSDANNNIYIANYNNNNILKVGNNGSVSILLGNVQKPYGLHIAGNILYISSQGTNSIIKYKISD